MAPPTKGWRHIGALKARPWRFPRLAQYIACSSVNLRGGTNIIPLLRISTCGPQSMKRWESGGRIRVQVSPAQMAAPRYWSRVGLGLVNRSRASAEGSRSAVNFLPTGILNGMVAVRASGKRSSIESPTFMP